MAYIRRKLVKGRYYLTLEESYRDSAGRVRKRVLEYLGPETPLYGKGSKVPRSRQER